MVPFAVTVNGQESNTGPAKVMPVSDEIERLPLDILAKLTLTG